MNELNTKIKVLLVDDFKATRMKIRSFLSEIGIENIDEADDGKSALSMLQQNHYDMVLADWNMPNMTGIELLKRVRADDNLKNLPFLMVTAEALKENIMAAIRADVSGYIMKPFTASLLKQKLKEIFNRMSAEKKI